MRNPHDHRRGEAEDASEFMSAARRRLLENMDVGVVNLSAGQLAACGGDALDTGRAAAITAVWTGIASELESGGLHRLGSPGDCYVEAESHAPIAEVRGREVTVWVCREMTRDHFTNHVFIKDQDGVIIGMVQLLGHDDQARITFSMPPGTLSVTPYCSCNRHGLWVGDTIQLD